MQWSLHLCEAARSSATATIQNRSHGTEEENAAALEVSLCEFRTRYDVIETLRRQCSKQMPIIPLASPDVKVLEDEPKPEPADDRGSSEQLGSPVVSFEEWKELMMRRQARDPSAGQVNESLEGLPQAASERDAADPETAHYETDARGSEETAGEEKHDGPGAGSLDEVGGESVMYDDGKMQYTRSKDAGKTCKERFSYSSFDAGATVLKTSPGAKNPKAILVENKDTYMLLECAAEQKYFIVELSDDILVDTVVLANFEFFSSMIRHFRVSVSDRYPVKLDKWRDLGTFEARNSRDIQPFLVVNPQIWAKYVRIELLSHYGNEYYCPVSLLRVHGTRMLESWQETEPEQDDLMDEAQATGNTSALALEGSDDGGDGSMGASATEDLCPVGASWFPTLDQTCPATQTSTTPSASAHAVAEQPAAGSRVAPRVGGSALAKTTQSATASSQLAASSTGASESAQASAIPQPTPTVPESPTHNATVHSRSQASSSAPVQSTTTSTRAADNTPSQARNKTSAGAASGPPASPTVQESFFKTVSKRLQLLESNVTWSLKYVEDQSRNLQEALIHIEKKRLSKVEAFLESLNGTLTSEISNLREQYDQMWQATTMALESQRERSQFEMVALSSRLNVLADEVVFQKRMSIAQAVLLLCCLVLIIFSRPVAHLHGHGARDAPHIGHQRASSYALYAVPEDSPTVYQNVSPPPSPVPTSTCFGALAPPSHQNATRQTPRTRPNASSTGMSRKPLPALPEYPDDHQQITP